MSIKTQKLRFHEAMQNLLLLPCLDAASARDALKVRETRYNKSGKRQICASVGLARNAKKPAFKDRHKIRLACMEKAMCTIRLSSQVSGWPRNTNAAEPSHTLLQCTISEQLPVQTTLASLSSQEWLQGLGALQRTTGLSPPGQDHTKKDENLIRTNGD
jgi:hypothetical protein